MSMAQPPVRGTLYRHQTQAYKRAMSHFDQISMPPGAGYGLLFEMGCGKTITAIAILGRLFLEGKIRRALVVAPNSVCPVWPAELEKWAAFPLRCQVLSGPTANRARQLERMAPGLRRELLIAVVNYESTWRLEREGALSRWAPDLILCDESQRIKDNQSAQAKCMHKLGAKAKFRLILSGTPIGNSPLDLFSQYRFLDPRVFGCYYMRFRGRYAVMGGRWINGKPVQVVAYKNLDELTAKAYAIASRATKLGALDLPEKTFERRPVPLGPAQMRAYRAMQRDSLAWLGEREATAANVLTRMLRLQQITGGFLKADEGGDVVPVGAAKLDALKEIVEDYVMDGGGKLVVYARFRAEIFAIQAMLDKLFAVRSRDAPALSYRGIYGDVKAGARAEAVERFQTDPHCRVFVGQTEAAAEGITLHAAHCMVFYSVDFSYMRYAQAQDRIHRIGQGDRCTYINLCCPGTIDETVLDALAAKKDLAVSVLDEGWKKLFTQDDSTQEA